MCDVQALSTYALQVPGQIAAQLQNGVEATKQSVGQALGHAWGSVVYVIHAADKVSKNNESLENAIRGFADSILAYDLITQPMRLIRPLYDSVNKFRSTASVVRIFGSIGYFVDGSFLKDFCIDQMHMFISQAAFLAARVGVVYTWLIDHQLIKDVAIFWEDKLSNQLKNIPIIDVFFIVALSGLVAERVKAFLRGEGSLYYFVDGLSLSSDIMATALPVLGVANTTVITGFAIVAAVTAVASFLIGDGGGPGPGGSGPGGERVALLA